MLGEGELVASHGVWTGTHQGEFMGIPATDKTVKVSFIDLWRFENGKPLAGYEYPRDLYQFDAFWA